MASAGADFATANQGGLEPVSTMARTMKSVTPSSTMRIIRVKRKRTETSNGDPVSYHPALKKLKFVGSSSRGDEETIKGLVLASSTSASTAKGDTPSVVTANIADVAVPTLAKFDEDLTITDFEDFVFSEKVGKSFPPKDEAITSNAIPLIPAPSHVGLEEEEDNDEDESGKYIYDVYLYDAKADHGENDNVREDSFLISEPRDKRRDRNHPLRLSHRQRDHLSEEETGKCDDDYSSNDEDHPDNDYPDEEDYDYNEYDYYREWEDDETREMMRAFEANCLHPDSEEEDKEGRRGEESDDDDLEWAGKEY